MMQLNSRNETQLSVLYERRLYVELSPMVGLLLSYNMAPYVMLKWRRRVLVFAPLLSVIAILVQASDTEFSLLAAGRFLQSMVCGIVTVVTYRSVEEYVPNWMLAPYFTLFLALNSALSTMLYLLGNLYLPTGEIELKSDTWSWRLYLLSPAILVGISFIGL